MTFQCTPVHAGPFFLEEARMHSSSFRCGTCGAILGNAAVLEAFRYEFDLAPGEFDNPIERQLEQRLQSAERVARRPQSGIVSDRQPETTQGAKP